MAEPTTTTAVVASALLGPAGGLLATAAIVSAVWLIHRKMSDEKPGTEKTTEINTPHGTVRLTAKSREEAVEIAASDNCKITLPKFVFEHQEYTDRVVKAVEAFAVVAAVSAGGHVANHTYVTDGDKTTLSITQSTSNPLVGLKEKFPDVKSAFIPKSEQNVV